MADDIDFYEVGHRAAVMVELGEHDFSRIIIREALGGMVADGYRLPSREDYKAKALALLDRLGSSDDPVSVKQRSLELMLFDRNIPKDDLEAFKKRYERRSVAYLVIAREKPHYAATMEFLEDIVSGAEYVGRGAAMIAKYATISVPLLLWKIGKKAKQGALAYYHMTDDERGELYKSIADAAKSISIGTGKFVYDTIDPIISGALLGGVFLPTGMRRFFSYARKLDESEHEEPAPHRSRDEIAVSPKEVMKVTSGLLGLSISFVFMLDCMLEANVNHHRLSSFEELIAYALPSAWAASALYEIGRFAAQTIKLNRERLESYNALHKAKLPSSSPLASAQSLDTPNIRVDVDSNDGFDEVPVYLDINGQEERVHAVRENTALPAKKMAL